MVARASIRNRAYGMSKNCDRPSWSYWSWLTQNERTTITRVPEVWPFCPRVAPRTAVKTYVEVIFSTESHSYKQSNLVGERKGSCRGPVNRGPSAAKSAPAAP
jgi:hypothetical protein